MVDSDSVRRLHGVLLDALADLRRYRETIARERLRTERDVQHMVLHALYVAIQGAVDLAMHLGADAGLPEAATYQDAFRRLGEAGIVEPELAARLAAWAGFRNVLAHLYPSVDHDRAYDSLSEIHDLEAFARIVSRMLEDS